MSAATILSDDEARQWMDAIAPVVGLAIPAASRDGVVAQLRLNHALIAPMLAFELPVEEAPPTPPDR